MPKNKRCPKCLTHPVLKRSDADSVLPTQQDSKSDSVSGKRAGLPVQVYICPNCNLVELYYSPSA